MAESELLKLTGVGPKSAKTLEDCGYNTIEKIAKATADELAQLPGIGKATAEKLVQSAKELESADKAPTKKPVTKPKEEVAKDSIPKPKSIETTPKAIPKKDEPMPSIKQPAVKVPVIKATPKKPAVKPTTKKSTVKKQSVYVQYPASEVARKAIEAAPEMRSIKKKRSSKKTKTAKKEKISETYGIVNTILHDSPGKSANNLVVMKLYNTKIPLPRYLGRKVIVTMPNSSKTLIGVISRLHGKITSEDKTVIVKFKKGVSPHIITAKATIA